MYHAAEGRAWTADEVGDRLKQAFAEAFSAGSAGAGRRAFIAAAGGRRLRPGEFIRAIQQLLGRTEECEMLFAWARSQVGIGDSLRETCRARGWAVSTVYDRRKRACVNLCAILGDLAFPRKAAGGAQERILSHRSGGPPRL